MFSFRKKDKDEKEKAKKEKKDKKKESKRLRLAGEPALTAEELGRLEEVGVKRGLFPGGKKKKVDVTPRGNSDTSNSSSLLSTPGDSNLGADSGSEQSLNSLERDNTSRTSSSHSTPVPSPVGDKRRIKSGDSARHSPLMDVKPQRPVPPPKPRGILKGKSSYKAPPYETVSNQVDDTTVLVENTLFNQEVPGRKSLLIEDGNIPQPMPESQPHDEKSFNVELSLPEVAPPKPPRSREVILNRQPAGDYGFSLRRSLIVERFAADNREVKKYVHFAEPGANKENVTGLLPGDRLVEVNGVNVEDMQRDQIVGMIRKSGQTVTLKVQPIPELSELSIRSGLDGGEVHVDAETLKSGSLQRSGSRRYKESIAKTEDQLASEKAWLKAEKVWLVHKGGFTAAKLLNDPALPEGKVKVKLEHGAGEEVLEVDEEYVEKSNPPHFDRVEDIATLRYLNESGVLHTLRQRYGSNLIHTYAGASLVIINPMSQLSIYAEKVMNMFKGCKQEDMPPHIYAIAQTAYRGMLSSRTDHSVVITGPSGSGKTTSVRHVLNYLAHVAGSASAKITVDKISSINVLIQAFGQSKTIQNVNATRCTQLYSLDFDHAGQVAAMSLQVLLLDKLRVVKRPPGEPNFNIFYDLLAGADQPLKNELHLNNLTDANLFLKPRLSPETKQKHSSNWALLLSACKVLGIRDEECRALWAVLAAIIHLGAAGAVKGGGSTKAQFANPSEAQKAATLLGTTQEELARAIFHPSSLTGTPTRTPFRTGSPAEKGDQSLNAVESLEGMVMGLYGEVVSAVVGLINRALTSNYRIMSSLFILDMPGFQDPSVSRQGGASFQDLCDNYAQERLQLLFHDTVFTSQQDKYAQENIDCDFDTVVSSPAPMVNLIDKVSQQAIVRPGFDSKNVEKKGLLWLLDEESIFPGANDESFMERFFIHYGEDSQKSEGLVSISPNKNCFVLNHFQGTKPVEYNATGWLGLSRENPVSRVAATVLQDSGKSNISSLFLSMRGSLPSIMTGSVVGMEGSSSLRRASSLRRSYTSGAAGIKRKSLCLQVKFQLDGLLDQLRRTKLHFVHCLLPQSSAGLSDPKSPTLKSGEILSVPLLRSQVRGAELLEAVRIYRQGYPDSMLFTEFRRRFEILAPAENKSNSPVLDEKKATAELLDNLDIDALNYRLGLSQVFFRSGSLGQLEDARDEKLTDVIVGLQAYCRGFLGRKKLKRMKIQTIAITCIQRNVRKYIQVRNWSWWRLLTKVTPLLDVHRTEEELRVKDVELEQLKVKFQKLEKERNELKQNYERMESKLSEMTTDLQEEHGTATHASEVLEAETAERMRLEKELKDLKTSYNTLQRKNEKMEMEVMEARLRASSIDGDMDSDEETDGTDSIYRQKYERARREIEFIKKKMQNEQEEEVEKVQATKKAVDRKLAEALEEIEEDRRLIASLKRKYQKQTSELQDMKLHQESQQARNSGLEKKQRKFDAELARAHEEAKTEKHAKEKMQREKEHVETELYQLTSQLDDKKGEVYQLEDKVEQLQTELRDLTSRGGKDENEILDLKRTIRELQSKCRDQEEELDDQAGTVQMLEQAKLRLEMQLQNVKQDYQKELDSKEEDVEEIRTNSQKRVKYLEAQLDDEYMEKQSIQKEKKELERKLKEKQEVVTTADKDTEKRLRKDLRKTKALLHDAQLMLDKQKESAISKTTVKQLQHELEEAQYMSQAATKSRKSMEEEIADLQQQLDIVSRTKAEAEHKMMTLTRENNDLQSKLDDEEEDFAELMRKHKSIVHQASMAQQEINDHLTTIAELTGEKQSYQERVAELNLKVNNLVETTVDRSNVTRLEGKIRDLDSRLDLEQTHKQRLEAQVFRLKESQEKLSNEKDSVKSSEQQAQELNRKLQKQLRDLREEFLELQIKEDDANRKKHELESQVEELEGAQSTLQADLKLAFRRINDLQNAVEDQLEEDSDLDDSGSDSDGDIDTWLRKHKRTPLSRERGDSVGSTDSSLRYSRRRSPEGVDDSYSSIETPKYSSSTRTRTFTSGSEGDTDLLPNTTVSSRYSSRYSDIDSTPRTRGSISDEDKDKSISDHIFSDDFNIKISAKRDSPDSPTSKNHDESPDSAVSVEEYI